MCAYRAERRRVDSTVTIPFYIIKFTFTERSPYSESEPSQPIYAGIFNNLYIILLNKNAKKKK